MGLGRGVIVTAIAVMAAVQPAAVRAQPVDAIQHVGAGLSAGLFAGGIVAVRTWVATEERAAEAASTGTAPAAELWRIVPASAAAALVAGNLAGLGKELLDLVGPGSAEFRDFAYTFVGSGLGALASAVLTATIVPDPGKAADPEPPSDEAVRTMARGMVATSVTLALGVVFLEVREQVLERRSP